jgi:hypothetical protein
MKVLFVTIFILDITLVVLPTVPSQALGTLPVNCDHYDDREG